MQKRNIIWVIVALFVSMALTACGRPKTCEEMFNKPLVKQAMEQQKEQELRSNSNLSNIEISASGNELEFDFYYAEGIELQPSMFEADDSIEKQINQLKDDFENDTGIRPETIVFKFYNSKLQMIKKLSF